MEGLLIKTLHVMKFRGIANNSLSNNHDSTTSWQVKILGSF